MKSCTMPTPLEAGCRGGIHAPTHASMKSNISDGFCDCVPPECHSGDSRRTTICRSSYDSPEITPAQFRRMRLRRMAAIAFFDRAACQRREARRRRWAIQDQAAAIVSDWLQIMPANLVAEMHGITRTQVIEIIRRLTTPEQQRERELSRKRLSQRFCDLRSSVIRHVPADAARNEIIVEKDHSHDVLPSKKAERI